MIRRMKKMARKTTTLPKCNCDCFASIGGRCQALTDNNFGGYSCPFYKPEAVDFNMGTLKADAKAYKERMEKGAQA